MDGAHGRRAPINSTCTKRSHIQNYNYYIGEWDYKVRYAPFHRWSLAVVYPHTILPIHV